MRKEHQEDDERMGEDMSVDTNSASSATKPFINIYKKNCTHQLFITQGIAYKKKIHVHLNVLSFARQWLYQCTLFSNKLTAIIIFLY